MARNPFLSAVLWILAIPLFILLHVGFTLSSLLLRIYEAFFSFSSVSPGSASSIDSSPTRTSESGSARERRTRTPKHLALILVPEQQKRRAPDTQRRAFVRSVGRAVNWAGERGVEEVSVWDGQGLTQSCLPALMRALPISPLPPSPPSSSPSSPTQDPITMSPPSTPSPTRRKLLGNPSFGAESGSETEYAPRATTSRIRQRRYKHRHRASLGSGSGNGRIGGITSVSVHVPKSTGETQAMTVHFLPPSTSAPLMGSIAREFAKKQIPVVEIDIPAVDKEVKEHLHFTHDPELLLIHHLSPLPWHAALLPRRAPELWGYPFWPLRITEIYQHPTPIPFIHYLSPMIHSFRNSSLPFARKLGYSISLPATPHPREPGVLQVEDWEGAMRAWSAVEQRLGR